MKKKILIIIILLFPMLLLSQTLNVHTNDGEIHNYTISDIDSITFTSSTVCGSPVAHQGKSYNTVLIGEQCWFAENLDVGTMIVCNGGEDDQTDNGIIEKYCYDNDVTNCDTYGGLYQWNETMQYATTEGAQGICPSGWHIPTYDELRILYFAVGGASDGEKLKAVGQGTGGGAGTNESGFSALLAGQVQWNSGGFGGIIGSTYSYAHFWSSTENDGGAYNLWLRGDIDNIYFDHPNMDYGYSVRCLKDE